MAKRIRQRKKDLHAHVTGWLRFRPGRGVATLLVKVAAGLEVEILGTRVQVEQTHRELRGQPVLIKKLNELTTIVEGQHNQKRFKLVVPNEPEPEWENGLNPEF